MGNDPKSEIVEAKALLGRGLRMPEYQRDFVWKSEKMSQLWSDILEHLQIHNMKRSNTSKDLKRYFLGTIVIENAEDGRRNIVDGQQRFTTLMIISAAVRDALIACGYEKEALSLDNDMIIHHNQINSDEKMNRFELLDVPPGHITSSEQGLKGYRYRIVPIPLSIQTVQTPSGSRSLKVRGKTPKAHCGWSVRDEDGWSFTLSDPDGRPFFNNHMFTAKPGKRAGLEANGFSPGEITLQSDLPCDVPDGCTVVLQPEVSWLEEAPPNVLLEFPTNAAGRTRLDDPSNTDLFHKERRDFYFEVRGQAEHFILGEKKYQTGSQKIESKDKTIGLNVDRSQKRSIVGWLGRLPSEEEIVFRHEIRVAPSEAPPPQELVELVNSLSQKGGVETQHAELKSAIRSNPGFYALATDKNDRNKRIKHHQFVKLSDEEKQLYRPLWKDVENGISDAWMEWNVTKTACAFMNTLGGVLVIGVRDSGEIMGIEIDGFKNRSGDFDADLAERHITQLITNKISKTAAGLVVPKVVFVEGSEGERVPVMYVKIQKWRGSEKPPRCQFPNGEEWFMGRTGSSTSEKLDEDEAESWIEQFKDREGIFDGEDRFYCDGEWTFKVGKSGSSQNWGRPRLSGSLINEDPIEPSSTCAIQFLKEGSEFADHLDSEKKRAEQLPKLISRVIFSRIEFNRDPAAAIEHFMVTNDAAKMEKLTVFDLASAKTQLLIRPQWQGQESKHQKLIARHWKSLAQKLYIETNKSTSLVETFFYYFLMASDRKRTPSARWSKDETWLGLDRAIENLWGEKKEAGQELVNFYSEMDDYSTVFLMANDPDKAPIWKNEPYNLAPYRDERTYLKTLSKSGISQHIPAYMALVQRMEKYNPELRTTVVPAFLKNMLYVWIRYRTIPKLSVDLKNGFTPGGIYSLSSGKEGWVWKIHQTFREESDGVSKEEVNQIINLPLQAEPPDKEIWPWGADCKEWKSLNKAKPKQNNDISMILYSYERASEGKTNPTMARIHSPGRPQVEHILPEKPDNWGSPWFESGEATDLHKEWVNSLGNRILLEDSKNSHVRNRPFEEKVPSNGCKPECSPGKSENHYQGSDFKSCGRIVEKFLGKKKWAEKEMEENATHIMNKVVEFFN